VPIDDNPDPDHPMRVIARYYSKQNKRRSILCLNRHAAEREIILNSGPKSAAELPKMSCASVVEWFLREQRRREVVSIDQIAAVLRNDFLGRWSDIAFGDLTEEHFWECRQDLFRRGLDPSTIRRACYLFGQLTNFAQLHGFIDRNPARVSNKSLPHIRPVNPALKFPREEHVDAIRLAGFPIAVAMIDVMVEAGAEPSQIERLLWADCDFQSKKIKLRGAPGAGDPGGDILSRTIDMTPRLVASLLRWKFLSRDQATEHVFINRDGRPYYPSALPRILDEAQVLAGLVSEPKPKPLRSKARAVGQRGNGIRNPQPGRVHVAQAGLYPPSSFRLLAGIRWARTESVKVVASRLGQSVTTVQQVYRHILDERRTGDFLNTLPEDLWEMD
jgi:integrase